MGERSTRRQLLAGGLGAAAGLAALAPTARADDPVQGRSPSGRAQDGQVLHQLLQSEQLLQYACQRVFDSGQLNQTSQDVVLLVLDQQQAHIQALQSHLEKLHLPPTPPSRQAQQAAASPPEQVTELFKQVTPEQVTDLFKQIKHEKDALQALVQIMNLVESGYFTAAASFHDAQLARLAAAILANQAQHWTMLVDLLHRGDATRAVPSPYVRGSMHISKPHP